MGRREVDDHIHRVQFLRSKRRAVGVVGGAKDADVVLALAGHLRHQRSRLAAA
jgi:hypothetical protein